MTLPPDDWPRLKEVFAAARALPADLRAAYLAEACAGNEALRHEVDSLLAVDTRAKRFLETPAVMLADPMGAKLLEGQRVGPYQIASRIGAGGMGEVYRARDARLGRDVAIKMLPRAFASDPDRLARFDREARMLASLNHPSHEYVSMVLSGRADHFPQGAAGPRCKAEGARAQPRAIQV